MKYKPTHLFWYLTFILAYGIAIFSLVFLTGCQQPNLSDPSLLESLIDVTHALTIATTASTPINPYALPIGVGLAGITAMLEALRRKERAGRKHAEGVINGNNHKP